jgi:hypothetical protein
MLFMMPFDATCRRAPRRHTRCRYTQRASCAHSKIEPRHQAGGAQRIYGVQIARVAAPAKTLRKTRYAALFARAPFARRLPLLFTIFVIIAAICLPSFTLIYTRRCHAITPPDYAFSYDYPLLRFLLRCRR